MAKLEAVTDKPEKKTFVRTEQEVESRFDSLLREWRNDTAVESVASKLIGHAAFRGMVGLGLQAVPFILRELERGKNLVWVHALEDITGENPVPHSHENNGRLIVADWLAWGKAHGAL